MTGSPSAIRDAILFREVGALPDRLVGLMAPIFLDQHLVQAIKAQWIDDGEVLEELFREGGAIGSFGTRIRVGFAVGLYSEEAYHDLIRINKIRNLFAHKLDAATFGHQQAHDLALAMTSPSRFPAGERNGERRAARTTAEFWRSARRSTEVADTASARGHFLRAAELLDAYLVSRATASEGQQESPSF